MSESCQQVISSVTSALAHSRHSDYVEAFKADNSSDTTHQFLFFAKPELLDSSSKEQTESRLSLVLGRLEEFSLAIERAIVVNGKYLGKYHVVSEHYGVIDSIARNPHSHLPDTGRETFEREFKIPFETAHVIGGIEYLRLHHNLNPVELSHQWLDRGYTKLSGGCYCQYLADEDLYLFNGFYPRLLKHYTKRSARIAIFVISGSLDWSTARSDFAGATNPHDARDGSIRRLLLEQANELGLDEISANLNGVHLSAGPVEALVELLRFTIERQAESALRKGRGAEQDIADNRHLDFAFGRELAKTFAAKTIGKILANPDVSIDDKVVSVFDYTEDENAQSAIEKLKQVENQLI